MKREDKPSFIVFLVILFLFVAVSVAGAMVSYFS
jgi:hypothetical protein